MYELTPKEITLLIELEEALWQEKTRYNLEFQYKVFADDFFEFGNSGRIWSREELIFESDEPINCLIPLDNFNIRSLSADVVQITYNSILTNYGIQTKSRRSSIWTKQNGEWQLRFHQGTPFQ